ncbi:HNH endonuclease signature motif containing protein [Tautonia rosea]|uniref:HNH endonuclease signature motif containing protein n=1 Tax=Tautonia rosea TaxID=2728037 RepID=UPI0014763C9A|nr:HNH endonuclease signature motif containing protein [Tautonia rosea]
MAKQRVQIPDDLAARVLFASDRTCCVCRLEKHKVQIHHIDENPSNNSFDNLAVICLHCHSDAHTIGAFVRNLTPELIKLYNSSWRDIVALRLHASVENSSKIEVEDASKLELVSEALLEASLDCHNWKIRFIFMAGPNNLPQGNADDALDIWDRMSEHWIPKYSEANYQRFKHLFDEGIRAVQERFDRLIHLFPDALPADFRILLLRANRQLEVERSVYLQLPALFGGVVSVEESESFFCTRFTEVVRVLRDVSREADRRRNSLTISHR